MRLSARVVRSGCTTANRTVAPGNAGQVVTGIERARLAECGAPRGFIEPVDGRFRRFSFSVR
jgi:hypothetical protein